MAEKKLNNKTKFGIALWLALLPAAIIISRHTQNKVLKISAFALVALGFAFIEFLKIRDFKKMGELEKTIQFESYALSFSIFVSFLFVFMLFYPAFTPSLEGEAVITIIILTTAIIRITVSVIIRKKYK